MSDDFLLLKWGSIKGYDFTDNWDNPKVQEAIERYNKSGERSMSAMLQHDNDDQKQALCDLIDVLTECPIINDWSGEKYTKEEAKEYIMNYGKDS